MRDKDVMSTVLTVVPDQPVKIDPDRGIELDLNIADDEAQTDPTRCLAVLKRLRPFSSQDMTKDDAKEVPGGCKKGRASGCSCLFVTPHLTTFAVVDAGFEVAGEPSADQLSAGVAVLAAPASGDGDGGSDGGSDGSPAPAAASSGSVPIVAIAAAAAGMALVAALVVIKRRQAPAAQHTVTAGTSQAPNPLRDADNVITGGASNTVETQVL